MSGAAVVAGIGIVPFAKAGTSDSRWGTAVSPIHHGGCFRSRSRNTVRSPPTPPGSWCAHHVHLRHPRLRERRADATSHL